MNRTYYIGLDVHKKSVSYCIKLADGTVMAEGKVAARREDLRQWAKQLPQPWEGAMEATLFSGWIYDVLKPYAAKLEMGHPRMLEAITAAKKKSDGIDAGKLSDLLRANLLPSCYVATPQIRELRRMLRYRNLVVSQAVRMKNRISGLLMETGMEYNQQRLHGKGYFAELMKNLVEVPESVRQLLRLSRASLEMFEVTQLRLLKQLRTDAQLAKRVERLTSIPGVGEVTALTWALEIADPSRFPSIDQAQSYCGLTSALNSSADKQKRGPISKQRNPHLQTVLIEAAKLAPRWNSALAAVHERELARGNRNQATLEVARKLVAYLMAVDRSQQPFQMRAAVVTAGAAPT
jgi:transposase